MYVCKYVIITTTTTIGTVWGGIGWFMGWPSTRAHMQLELVWQIAVILGLVGFGIWFSALSFRMNSAISLIEESDDRVNAIQDACEQVVLILNRLPDLQPQWSVQNAPTDFLREPVQALVNAFVSNLNPAGQPPGLNAHIGLRDDAGRFSGTTKETENDEKTQG